MDRRAGRPDGQAQTKGSRAESRLQRDRAQVPQWSGTTTVPSAQPQEAEYEKDDDDGTDEPDDSVHDGYPLPARVGCKRGRPAHIGMAAQNRI